MNEQNDKIKWDLTALRRAKTKLEKRITELERNVTGIANYLFSTERDPDDIRILTSHDWVNGYFYRIEEE